ncbi:LOW QUALITY PROTEIN: tudor domain-containing protein 7A [Gouania willdenowi]|uniref:LOW QUALITY PROTEIN: tudor domain-containing protein 7A n=1 Tax=Gouania willdenowi TaxID=441366 RepID=UPI001055BD69|nr:LOW QUALITY PROTEIN: tudor domain-containing protein 7A-like [Gouania willdenowi]
MSDNEFTKKMLRSLLLSSKDGVSLSALQSEYRSLCGEFIPLRKLGFSSLEDYLKSISSVVCLRFHKGELRCFAVSNEDTAHIAELVARQKSIKKRGSAQVINCKMRAKPFNYYMFNVPLMRSSFSLRQPSGPIAYNWSVNRYRHGYRGCSATGDYRKFDQRLSPVTPVEERHPFPKATFTLCTPPHSQKVPSCTRDEVQKEFPAQEVTAQSNAAPGVNEVMMQSRITQLLQRYCKGLWLSKLPDIYNQMFGKELHPQALINLEKWTHICTLEKPQTTGRADRLIYPALPTSNSVNHKPNVHPSSPINSVPSSPSSPLQLSTHPLSTNSPRQKVSPNSPLDKPTFLFPPQPDTLLSSAAAQSPTDGSAPTFHLPPPSSDSNQLAQLLLLTLGSTKSGNTSPPVSVSQPNVSVNSLGSQSSTVLSADLRKRLEELLSKYSQGIWAHALPKLFMDTYQMQFPEEILNNLSLLLDICTVEYPMPNNKKKAILYDLNTAEWNDKQGMGQCSSHTLPSGLKVQGPVIPPPLVFPSEQYPSVLVTEAKSSNALTIRYVGEKYSYAQELMEDMMHSLYSQNRQNTVSNPTLGQLVAVIGEDEEELARGQVIEVGEADKVKIYYLDYGFSVETSTAHLFHLHQDFAFLPFQATNIRLAGLEAVSSHPLLLSTLEKVAVGRILLMENLKTCQQNETPVAILHDTSKDVDININSFCLKALQDAQMNNPLCVNIIYHNVGVTNVCDDGIIHCQLPSRGIARLQKSLDNIEAVFISQNTSEFLVSRPFTGKFCLVRYKGKWARAEIITIHSDRVIEILFIDFGISATVEITDLREIPPFYCKDIIIIPPQATKCRLADLTVPDGVWSPEAVLYLKEAVQDAENCSMKIVAKEEHKGDQLVYVYLFITADGEELHHSVNHQLAKSEKWQKLTARHSTNNTGNTAVQLLEVINVLDWNCINGINATDPGVSLSPDKLVSNAVILTSTQPKELPLPLPPPLEFPQNGQNLDVFVSVACHPGYFVLQRWDDLHKLVVLIGEMVLYYNQTGIASPSTPIKKGEIYAARVDRNWYRVQVKAVLSNGLASVYELDHGKHELSSALSYRPLIEEFRQLPFQAIAATTGRHLFCLLTGVKHCQWSERASMLFRNHVENRALVAQVEHVQELSEVSGDSWERRLTVYLVDTKVEDKDIWVHSIMADIEC